MKEKNGPSKKIRSYGLYSPILTPTPTNQTSTLARLPTHKHIRANAVTLTSYHVGHFFFVFPRLG